jgi:hypothetical protein
MLLKHKEKGNAVHRQAPDVKAGPVEKPDAVAPLNSKLATWVGAVSLVLSLVLISSVRLAAGQSERAQSPTAARHSSGILIDEVEHLPALAWKAIPISLPHAGVVNIDVQVVRGNPIDVFLTTSDQIDNAKKVEWNNLKVHGDIGKTRTKTFSKGVRLGQGGFYLVVRDMTIGVPSSQPTDVSVKVQLNP